uniref:Uncharacterized protein n=1 Tax=Anguilla anguilla TaxID=7936 RepID=A0A0E9U5W0_ANGAN
MPHNTANMLLWKVPAFLIFSTIFHTPMEVPPQRCKHDANVSSFTPIQTLQRNAPLVHG